MDWTTILIAVAFIVVLFVTNSVHEEAYKRGLDDGYKKGQAEGYTQARKEGATRTQEQGSSSESKMVFASDISNKYTEALKSFEQMGGGGHDKSESQEPKGLSTEPGRALSKQGGQPRAISERAKGSKPKAT